MSTQTADRNITALREIQSRLAEQLVKVGMTFSVWDTDGRSLATPSPGCDVCRLIGECYGDRCLADQKDMVTQAMAEAKPVRERCSLGCCMLAVPIYRRRRVIGAALGCFPVRQMFSPEGRDRMREQGIRDEQVEAIAEMAARHEETDAEKFLEILIGMVQREQAIQIAEEELGSLSSNLATTYEELNLVYRVSGAMRVTQHPNGFLQQINRELLEVIGVEAVVVVVYAQPPAIEDDLIVTKGVLGLDSSQVLRLINKEIRPQFDAESRPVIENEFIAPDYAPWAKHIRNYLAMTLVADEDIMGVLVTVNKVGADFDSVDIKLMSSIASQASVFLQNNKLYAEEQDLLMGVLHALTASIDAKDPYTCGHSQRVANLSRALAEAMDFSEDRIEQVYLAGLLHDIGKIGIPEAILSKPGRLTPEEYEILKQHPSVAAKILSGIRQLDDIIGAILTHHERPDGLGYPQGLRGEAVPLEGLIVGLADAVDAMTSDRTYRKALSYSAAIEEVQRCSGTQFAPALVEKLTQLDLKKFLEGAGRTTPMVFPVTQRGETQ